MPSVAQLTAMSPAKANQFVHHGKRKKLSKFPPGAQAHSCWSRYQIGSELGELLSRRWIPRW